MPFKSEKQKGWMFANKPEMAREWAHKYGTAIAKKNKARAKKKGPKT